ncbi:hypothetical protein FSP39_009527 [Pinctada imbricata]|uniref:Uncharacterized protein n=1 Tax=Pinctada imbricata TaxID=66713 RepID=A0AA88XZZ8_PINIB|nr:hypothetical protein FSP39_009527 [Pinctada imbricata]
MTRGSEYSQAIECHHKNALKILSKFWKEKGLHEQSLVKVLNRKHSEGDGRKSRDSDIAVALSEHLLARLAPGQSYVIDQRAQNRRRCSCGEIHCQSHPTYGSNGIGHEAVWHGFADVIFASDEGIHPESTIATIFPVLSPTESSNFDGADSDSTSVADMDSESPSKKSKYDDSESEEDFATEGRSGTEDQCIAQTIVFSFIQRARHPEFKNHLIPNIVIDCSHFRVLMYDSENDILLCSMLLPIFRNNKLCITSIIILWMVLHYRIFCSGIDKARNLEVLKCNFSEIVGEKLDIYSKALKVGEAWFPVVQNSSFPSNDILLYGRTPSPPAE